MHVNPAQVPGSSDTQEPGLPGSATRHAGLPPAAETTRSGQTETRHPSHAAVSRVNSRRSHVADVRSANSPETIARGFAESQQCGLTAAISLANATAATAQFPAVTADAKASVQVLNPAPMFVDAFPAP